MKSSILRAALLGAALVASLAVQAQTKIVVGHTGVAEWLSVYVAQEQGFFKKNGLDVTLQPVAGGALIPGLQSESLQVATIPPTQTLLAIDGGLDLMMLAGTSVVEKTDQNMGLVAGSSSGITTARDLVGKKVGVPSIGGFLYVMGRKWIKDRGVDPKSVGFVEVNFAQMNDLLKAGTVHAVVTAAPFLQRAVQTGNGQVLAYFPADLPSRTSGGFYTVARQWANANPQAARAFRAGIEEAAAFVQKDPQAARADMAKYIRLPPEMLTSIPLPRLAPEVSEAQLKFWVDAMGEMSLIKSAPDVQKLIFK